MSNREKPIQERAGLLEASQYQIDIFNAIEKAALSVLDGNPAKSILVQATAGAGKTTSLTASANLIPEELSTIFVAFNKSIAAEFAGRLPKGVIGRTLHSFWYRQWGFYCKSKHGKWPEVDNFKIRNAVDKYFGIDRRKKKQTETKIKEQEALEEMVDNVVFLVEKAKLFGVVPNTYQGRAQSVPGMGDCEEFWTHISDFFDQQIEPEKLTEAVDIAREILCEGLDNDLEVDFSDMLYMSAVNRIPTETFHVVMVDECQDLNSLQHYLLSRMVDSTGILVGIGDRRQSLYGFAGAAIDGMDELKERFDCLEFPLSISYRCAQKIVDHARTIYPEIEARPNAPPGSVEYPKEMRIEDFTPGDLIICRNNAPTVELAYKLIRHQIPAKVIGRDIGKGLNKIIKRLDRDGTIPTMMERLVDWRERQFSIIERKPGDQDRAKGLVEDKYRCISMLAQAVEVTNVTSLCALIDRLFMDSEETNIVSRSRVTLSTIHKIKGAEAETVYLLDPHLINPAWMKGAEWKTAQEENLRFVACTRAKNRLIYIRSDQIV